MKSGTAQKLVLNMLTTASMVRIGKSYQNLMVDVKATNKKLVARAVRIVMQATECSAEQATQALEQCEYEVKTAILIQLTGLSCQEARRQIQQTSGFLGKAIQQAT
ncbi:N-acetylmuramic acid 6-phosphate etherase [Vibrio astriarenae]|nr:N-acetylmuramic acid 6-phosphate etherase [Vibrio sp. C7]